MSDAYKIGVSVVLTNLIGSELTRIANEFGIANKSAAGFAVGLGAVSIAMAAVTATMIAGINEARRFQVEVAKFSMFGMGDRTNREAQSFAENMRIVGTSATEAMHLMVEAQGVFRESGLSDDAALRGAKMAAPLLAKIDFIGKTLDGESASKMHSSAQAMLRFIDMQGGLNDPERFNEIANAGFKAMRSSGGNIDWEQYRQFRARGASAAANLSDEALFGEFEPIIQELKGSTAGFSLRSAYNRLNGIIRLPNQAAQELIKIGAWDQSQVIFNSQGGIKSFKGNPLRDSDLYAKDPIAYYEKYILPYYDKMGMSQEERTRENALLFGSTGGNLFSIAERQSGAIHRSVDSWRKALGVDDSVDVAKSTVDGKMVQLTSEWATLMKNIGMELLPAVNAGLGYLASILKFINDHWDAVRSAAKTMGNMGMHVLAPGLAPIMDAYFDRPTGANSAVPPPSSGTTVPITVQSIIDGKLVAESTANHFLGGMDKSPSAGNSFDLRTTPSYAGFAY